MEEATEQVQTRERGVTKRVFIFFIIFYLIKTLLYEVSNRGM